MQKPGVMMQQANAKAATGHQAGTKYGCRPAQHQNLYLQMGEGNGL